MIEDGDVAVSGVFTLVGRSVGIEAIHRGWERIGVDGNIHLTRMVTAEVIIRELSSVRFGRLQKQAIYSFGSGDYIVLECSWICAVVRMRGKYVFGYRNRKVVDSERWSRDDEISWDDGGVAKRAFC